MFTLPTFAVYLPSLFHVTRIIYTVYEHRKVLCEYCSRLTKMWHKVMGQAMHAFFNVLIDYFILLDFFSVAWYTFSNGDTTFKANQKVIRKKCCGGVGGGFATITTAPFQVIVLSRDDWKQAYSNHPFFKQAETLISNSAFHSLTRLGTSLSPWGPLSEILPVPICHRWRCLWWWLWRRSHCRHNPFQGKFCLPSPPQLFCLGATFFKPPP